MFNFFCLLIYPFDWVFWCVILVENLPFCAWFCNGANFTDFLLFRTINWTNFARIGINLCLRRD
jgi:hypothetical protein